ncbi:MAG TPA: hypothetical protein DDY78_08865 [Planctomycetales bacterium]|jgi:hypothetical protein|nr:hypothetical protein [Planctomycetales bacterium]
MLTYRRRIALLLILLAPVAVSAQVVKTTVDPASISLRGPCAVYSLLVDDHAADGRLVDRTRDAHFRSLDPKVATVTPAGVVHAVGDGQTTVIVEIDGHDHNVAVSTVDATTPRRFNFENDVEPVLSRYGCNSAGCHGKAEGQNGFKLSVFGFDPSADYAALVKEARGRRIFPASPEYSLVLRKTSGHIAHGGGVRLPAGSDDYETLRAWIAAGAPFGQPTDPKTTAVRVEPRERLLTPRGKQQLRVIARTSEGREVDVTALAKFQSNNDGLASVQPGGLVTAGDAPGEAAVMASFMNQVDVFRVVVPRAEHIDPYPVVPENNFIDRLVLQKLRKLNIAPSDLADDAEYLRRVTLDVIGTLPTPAEARRFLDDRRPNKRAILVDELLERPEYADYWSLQWSDLLRVDRQALGSKRAYAYYQWIRRSVVSNQPFDQFARAVVTAEGPLGEDAAADFYKVVTKPGDEAGTLSQVFLGVRIACAECHHHPFDRWSTADYYGMTAYFSGIAVKPLGRDETLCVEGIAAAKNPRTGEEVFAHPFGEPAPTTAPQTGDRRAALADWMTRPDNPYFARNLANRVWARFLGRGLIEPVDDVRVTNPPSNPELLDALAHSVVENKFDVKALIRTITASRVYQLSSKPNATNECDEQNYSRALFKRIEAEVLLDMVCQTTGVAERFDGMPAGMRAIQLWDSKTSHYFLKVFGRPMRASACECERRREPSSAQVLHLLNGPEIQAKLSRDAGYIAKLAKREGGDESLVEDLYLTFYSRRPTAEETTTAVAYIRKEKDRRREAVEDLAWTLMNSLEFGFNH